MASAPKPEDLLAGIRLHNRAAMGQLYGRFAPSLLGLALRTLGDQGAAEAVVEEVFLQLWNETRRVDLRGTSVAAQLLLMARTAAVRRLRSKKGLANSTVADSDRLQTCPAWLPSPEEIESLDRRRELLKKLMQQLPPPQRQTLDLVVFEGYTETEVAEKLGEPLGRVKSELRAGMRFLRHRLRAVLGTWSANI